MNREPKQWEIELGQRILYELNRMHMRKLEREWADLSGLDAIVLERAHGQKNATRSKRRKERAHGAAA